MAKKLFSISRSVEDLIIRDPNNQAEQILEWKTATGSGPCEECVFYRNMPGVYCLRYGECLPETRGSWRGRKEGIHYGPKDTQHILDKS